MSYVPREKIIKSEETSLYKSVLTAASRANELAAGATPLVECESKKVSTIAMQELAEGKVSYKIVDPKDKK